MRVVGLITEYNPFHNGHWYHMEQARRVAGADAVIVVMSGDFVQRGTPAIMPKHLRAKAALMAGASLVLELPVCYATGSAELFARGAISLLDKLGCVDAICFGSECGDIKVLEDSARILTKEPEEYKTKLKEFLKNGDSFPLARQKALCLLSGEETLLSAPNNILGIEYLKALHALNSSITPFTISRTSSYHEEILQQDVSSATAIRKVIEIEGFVPERIKNQIPRESFALFQEEYQKSYPILANDFSLLLKYKLLSQTRESLTAYADVSKDLANRILNHRKECESFDSFCMLLKTKEVTYSRISRCLLHILLDIKKEDITEIGYGRILGIKKEDQALFSMLKKTSRVPLIAKLADAGIYDTGTTHMLTSSERSMLRQDVFASDLYESVASDKFHVPFHTEFQKQIALI